MLLLLQSLNSKSIIALTLNNLILLPYKWSYDKTTEILKKTKQKKHTHKQTRYFFQHKKIMNMQDLIYNET